MSAAPSDLRIVKKELSFNKVSIAFEDGLRALLHQCLTANPEYTALIEAVSKPEDRIENCKTHKVTGELPSGLGNGSASASYDFDACQHEVANDDLRKARAERDAMLKRVYNEEVLPVVIEAANDATIRACLEAFGAVLQDADSEEEDMYKPYVELCHAALDHFRTVPQDDDQRSTLPNANSTLDIRFLSNHDPRLVNPPVRESAEGCMERKPNIICTSRAAERRLSSSGSVGKVAWPYILQSIELKRGSSQTTIRVPERSETFEGTHFKMTVTDAESPPSCQGADPQKCNLEGTGATGGQPKRFKSRSKHSGNPPRHESASQVQTGAYGLAMLSHSQGVKHIINLTVRGQWATLMLINRQSIFVTEPFDILNDFPNFLAMLFLLQRFTLENWGIVPTLNPSAVAALEGRAELPKNIVFQFETNPHHRWSNNPTASIVIEPEYLNHRPRTLLGRATAVRQTHLDGDGDEKLACKIYNPEVARPHEGKTLVAVHAIVNKVDPTMRRHLPTLKAYADVPETDTRWLQSLLNKPITGHRVTRVLVFDELWPIERTLDVGRNDQGETVGDEEGRTFIKAWLDIVKCHAFLWENLVDHGDISLNNCMFNPRLKCGVLIDFDLSVFRWGPRRVPGIDRTGTIPFMAIRLLCEEYWAGKIVRRYFDELEALCWILPFVWLGGTKPGSPIDCWKTHDYNACVKEKTRFLWRPTRWDDEYEPEATRRFVQYIVYGVIKVANTKLQAFEDEQLFRTLSEAPDKGEEDASTPDPGSFPGHDKEVLELLLGVLGKHTAGLVPTDYVANFPKPTFTKPTAEEANRIIDIVGTDLFV